MMIKKEIAINLKTTTKVMVSFVKMMSVGPLGTRLVCWRGTLTNPYRLKHRIPKKKKHWFTLIYLAHHVFKHLWWAPIYIYIHIYIHIYICSNSTQKSLVPQVSGPNSGVVFALRPTEARDPWAFARDARGRLLGGPWTRSHGGDMPHGIKMRQNRQSVWKS